MKDYKEKYEAAIKQAKEELKTCGSLDCDAARQIFRFFPELKENKREWIEKIRQELKSYLEHREIKQISESDACHQWISWLEKQGEEKLLNNDKYQTVSVEILDRLYESEKELERLKQEWSEDDEMMFTLCASSVQTRYNDGLLTYNEYEQASLWLKSLKERLEGRIKL